jgi:hypothetical protein
MVQAHIDSPFTPREICVQAASAVRGKLKLTARPPPE